VLWKACVAEPRSWATFRRVGGLETGGHYRPVIGESAPQGGDATTYVTERQGAIAAIETG